MLFLGVPERPPPVWDYVIFERTQYTILLSIQILGVAKSHGEGRLDPTVLAIVVSIGSLFSCDWPFLPQPWFVFFLHLYKPPGVIDSFELEVIFHT